MPRSPRDRPWVVIFILVSLLAHLLFVVAIVLISHFVPTPKLKNDVPASSVSLSLEQAPPPPPTPTPPPHPRPFVQTKADALAQHKETEIESDHDARLKTKSKVARLPDSVMPDVVSKEAHPTDLNKMPEAPSKEPPKPATVNSLGKDNQQKQTSPQAPTPTEVPQTQPALAKNPSQIISKTPSPTPSKMTTPEVAKVPLDANGLPVLPPISAPTMAPASQHQEAQPASSNQEIEQDVHGGIGASGDNSPEAMETELGKYKAYVRAVVGSYWYPKVDRHFQVLPVGLVHIQFTIHSDGSVETKVLEGDQGALQLLLSISQNAITQSAPYKPFSPAMIQEVGDSYTDDYSFSIYGQ